MRDGIAYVLNLPVMALVQRDLVRSLRRARPFAILFGMVLVLAVIVVAAWPTDVTLLYEITTRTSIILGYWCFLLLTALGLFIPAFGSTTVVSEREEETYDLLSMTLVTPWGVVLGKLISLLGYYALLVIGCAPLLATLFFLLGFDWFMFLTMLAMLAVTALVCASAAILCSALCRRVAAAVLLSFLCAAWIMGAQFAFLGITGEVLRIRELESFATDFGIVLSPVGTMAMVFAGSMGVVGIGLGKVAIALVYHVMCAVVALFLARYLISRATEPHVPEEGGRRHRRTTAQQFRWLVFGGNLRHGPIGRLVNPMYAAETRYSALTRGPVRRRVFAVTLLLCFLGLAWLAAADVTPSDGEEFIAAYVGCAFVVLCTAATGIVANSMTKERERRNLDMLRASLLSPYAIVWGKVRAGLATMRAAVLAVLVAFAIGSVLSPMGPRWMFAAVQGFITLAICCLLCVAVSIFASTIAKRTTTAILVSYLISAWVNIGLFAISLIMLETMVYSPQMRRWLRQGNPSPQDIVIHATAWVSPPVVYFVNVFEDRRYFSFFWITSMMAAILMSVAFLWLTVRVYRWRDTHDA
ncbi:MAG: ABC transporter permease [bacterium]|nr:ABC transporter permease [bacterium]